MPLKREVENPATKNVNHTHQKGGRNRVITRTLLQSQNEGPSKTLKVEGVNGTSALRKKKKTRLATIAIILDRDEKIAERVGGRGCHHAVGGICDVPILQ